MDAEVEAEVKAEEEEVMRRRRRRWWWRKVEAEEEADESWMASHRKAEEAERAKAVAEV